MYYTLVTGATGVLGKCFCTELAKQNNNLIITGRNLQNLNRLKEELTPFKVEVKAFSCDMENEKSRAEFFLNTKDYKINRLVLVAGNDNQFALSDYSQEKAITQIRVNFESVVDLSRHFIPLMEGGEVLAISSLTAILPMPYFAIYSACKRAMLDFFTAIRYEFPQIKFSVALPGSMPTRPDVIEDIKKQGLTGKLACQSPQKVAGICLKKVGRKIILIGLYNRIVYFMNKITPKSLRCRLIAKKFKNKRKENF